ncbi:MAG: hypothetical protein ACP5N1_02680 [Candidatus Woesearchaeota archaeon]
MRVPQPQLLQYMQNLADSNLSEAFFKQLSHNHTLTSPYYSDTIDSNRDKSLEFYSSDSKLDNLPKLSIPVTASITTIVTNFDGNGQKITKGHKLYELSDAIGKFNSGLEIDLSIKKDETFQKICYGSLEDYFRDQGVHFCAGYLSQFGKITVKNTEFPLARWIGDSILKIIHNKSYNAALKVYLTEKYKK